MKRVKLVFIAALGIMGYVGAHAASGINQAGTLYRKLGANNYQQLDPSQRGSDPGQWNCRIVLDPPTCTYEAKEGVENPSTDADFQSAESGEFQINP